MKNIRIEKSARLKGKLRFGDGVYIAQGTIIVSEGKGVKFENNTWVLENSVVIGTDKNPVNIGQKTVFGHRCVVIGAEIGNLCEVGNGVIILPGAKIGNMCIFGEGTIIPEGKIIPDGSVVVGRPGRIVRKLTEEDKNIISRMRGGDPSLTDYTENIIDVKSEGDEIMGTLHSYKDKFPQVDESATIEDTAELTGDVKIGKNSYIGHGVKIIGNAHGPVIIGDNVKILENSVLHLLPDNQLIIEDNVVIGPSSMIHGTKIGQNTIVESGSIVCDYSALGPNCLVKSGSLIKQRDIHPENSILSGFPAKSIGENSTIQETPDWAYRS